MVNYNKLGIYYTCYLILEGTLVKFDKFLIPLPHKQMNFIPLSISLFLIQLVSCQPRSPSEQALILWNKLVGRSPSPHQNSPIKLKYKGIERQYSRQCSAQARRHKSCPQQMNSSSKSYNYSQSFALIFIFIFIPFLFIIN